MAIGSGKASEPLPVVSLRNETDKEMNIMPLKMTVWLKQKGQQERTFKTGELSVNKVQPHKEMMLPLDAFKFEIAPTDQVEKLRLSVGSDADTFTISR